MTPTTDIVENEIETKLTRAAARGIVPAGAADQPTSTNSLVQWRCPQNHFFTASLTGLLRRKYPCPKCLAAEARAKKATRTERRLQSTKHSRAENARLTTEIQEAHADSQKLTLAIEQLADELSTAQATIESLHTANAHLTETITNLRRSLTAQSQSLQSAQEASARARDKISYLQQVAEDEAERAGIYVAEAERARVEINYLQAVAERQQAEITAYQSESSPMPATPRLGGHAARRWASMDGW